MMRSVVLITVQFTNVTKTYIQIDRQTGYHSIIPCLCKIRHAAK